MLLISDTLEKTLVCSKKALRANFGFLDKQGRNILKNLAVPIIVVEVKFGVEPDYAPLPPATY